MTARTTTDHIVLADDEPVDLQPVTFTGGPLTIYVDGELVTCELLFTIGVGKNGDKAELAYRPVHADAWTRWSPPVRLTREALPVAATRTQPGICTCPDVAACSDAAVR